MTKKENFKKINFNQAKKLMAVCRELIKKNTLYTDNDFDKAWEQFNMEQNKIKNNDFVKMLASGNLKLGACVGVWDLPAIITCKGACVGCYALKAERLYKNTRVARLRHLLHVLYAMYNPLYKKAFINNFIKNCNMYNIIRFHGSGDIFSENYKRILLDIVKKCNKIIKNEFKNNGMPCYICKYQDMEHGMCMVSCKKCLTCPHVLFQKH